MCAGVGVKAGAREVAEGDIKERGLLFNVSKQLDLLSCW